MDGPAIESRATPGADQTRLTMNKAKADKPHQILRSEGSGSGKPLATPMRDLMETRFNADFGDVRVYSSPAVDCLTAALGTSAFTFEDRIFCSSALANCSQWTYRYVIAHELAHVLQKRVEPLRVRI